MTNTRLPRPGDVKRSSGEWGVCDEGLTAFHVSHIGYTLVYIINNIHSTGSV